MKSFGSFICLVVGCLGSFVLLSQIVGVDSIATLGISAVGGLVGGALCFHTYWKILEWRKRKRQRRKRKRQRHGI